MKVKSNIKSKVKLKPTNLKNSNLKTQNTVMQKAWNQNNIEPGTC